MHPSLLDLGAQEALLHLLFFWKEVICLLAILNNVPIFPRYDFYIPFLDMSLMAVSTFSASIKY